MSDAQLEPERRPARVPRSSPLPGWTRHVVTDPGGRDPLGLSRVSFHVTDRLMPGIVVNTDRARYYALHLWNLWHVRGEEGVKRARRLAGFQRRDAAIAYATLLADEDASVVGSVAAKKYLAAAKDDVATEVRMLPSNALGGYGQYYAGSLYALGLTHRPDGEFDEVTPGFASELAEATHSAIASTPYLRDRHFESNRVPVAALRASASRLSLDAIRKPASRAERNLLTALFFARRTPEEACRPSERRQSLLRILAVLREYGRQRISVHLELLDQQLLYAPVYFAALIDAGDGVRPYRPPRSLADCSIRWRQFCAHEYLTWAVETIFSSLLEFLLQGGSSSVGAAAAALASGAFDDTVRGLVGVQAKTPAKLLASIGIKQAPDAAACATQRRRWGLTEPLNEMVVVGAEATTPPARCGVAVVVLALLFAKWRAAQDDPAFAALAQHAGRELAAPTVLPGLDAWLGASASWEDALAQILGTVVRTHDRVMYEKQRLESCWIERSADALTWVQDYEPDFRASRHRQAVSILRDLLLIEEDRDGEIHLSKSGAALLEELLQS